MMRFLCSVCAEKLGMVKLSKDVKQCRCGECNVNQECGKWVKPK